ncbi:MDR family MFS transporter [Jiulongibacter sediminis]|uniref:Major facilitator transporter n=1 Tax=Jiulongibacter sediminis TaxID=1605367 RepID=A0A0P7BFF6_9BACT|nr:MFS transporter [Jiulongibacter sediminis]KPM49591.1 major facilitator transporter [Jiulongibacter sediminis]TBX26630.1 major facilitator transporter [Jiulongibacter sediminis]
MKKLFNEHYVDAFRGLSHEVWILALVSLINRAGTMVIPFLSKYLKENLQFSYGEVGWIMFFFGIGSFAGAWLGGRLSDKIGYYKVMVGSLLASGFLFIALQYLDSFWGLCIGIFILMTIADAFRPAMFVSLGAYSKPENRTRSLTLIRLALNLGFVIGPSLAGLLIVSQGYNMLFWIDGISCIMAILIFIKTVPERKSEKQSRAEASLLNTKAQVFKDGVYWQFLAVCFLVGMVFFQIFTTLPIYHSEQFGLTEFHTGLLFFLNGALIVVFEMPLIHWLEKKAYGELKLIRFSTFLLFLSFAALLFDGWAGMLVISMVLITFSEMLGFPYTNAFAMQRSKKGNEGRYMALYTMAFGLSNTVSPKLGLDVVEVFGYQTNFILLCGLSLLAVLLTNSLIKKL